ncbi:MAG: glycosyltransferase family 4 protein [Caldilineaceae bacterium]|nr:glycosyltransferase family 4 protein [Caldilineaceae bacterium]
MAGRIRVLHPITRLIVGGAQENTLLTAQLLNPYDWAVDVVTGPQTGSEGSLIETAKAREIPLIIEPSLVREVNPIQDLRALFRLARLIRRGQYTIVHTHSSKAGIVGRWAAKIAGAPVIVHTVHGWGHHDHQHPLVRAYYILLEKLTLPITDKLIVVSPRNIEKGLADGIGKPDDYVVIRSGIEMDRFGHPQTPRAETRAAWGIPADAPVVGAVTRLSPQKGPLDFVRAAAEIGVACPSVWFLMVGDGPMRGEVERLARELGLAERLVLTGLRRDVPELMAAMDLFALSSLWEGLPRVLPQAMATGLPIVATAIDGSSEAIDEGVNGLLTPPGDPHALAQGVIRLLRDPALARRMGEAGRARAAEFDVRAMVAQIDGLYRALLAKKKIGDGQVDR